MSFIKSSIIVKAFVICTTSRLSFFTAASNYGMSIGDLMGRDNTFPGQAVPVQSSYYQEPAEAQPLGLVPDESKPMSALSQRELRAFYNDTGFGYDIKLPGWLCADILLGDWIAPSGEQIVNGSLGDLAQQLRLPPKTLAEYTLSRADAFQRSVSDSLGNVLCQPIPSSGRTLTYDGWRSQDLEGFWVAYILAGVSTTVIGWTGLHYGIIHEGITANITLESVKIRVLFGLLGIFVYILTATAVFEFLAVTTIFRLQTNGYISYVQAVILNAIWTMGEVTGGALRTFWADTCAEWETFRNGVVALANQALNRLFVFNPRTLSRGGGSTLDLVGQGQDVESGNEAPGIGEGCVAG